MVVLPPGTWLFTTRSVALYHQERGSLQHNIICHFTTSVIEQGFRIPFISNPPAFAAVKNQSSLQHRPFVDATITELLNNNCIKEHASLRRPPNGSLQFSQVSSRPRPPTRKQIRSFAQVKVRGPSNSSDDVPQR